MHAAERAMQRPRCDRVFAHQREKQKNIYIYKSQNFWERNEVAKRYSRHGLEK